MNISSYIDIAKVISNHSQKLYTIILLIIAYVTMARPEKVGTTVGILIILYTIILGIDVLYENYIKHKRHVSELKKILKKCVYAIESLQGRSEKGTLRANIMLMKKGKLRIEASYRMEYSDDKDIIFEPGQGCAGHAYESKKVVIGNLDEVYKDSWEETIDNPNHTIWGIKKEHFERTKTLKSLLSIPLYDTIEEDKVIGVFNLDDRITVKEALFKNENVLIFVDAYISLIPLRGSDVLWQR